MKGNIGEVKSLYNIIKHHHQNEIKSWLQSASASALFHSNTIENDHGE